MAKKPILLQAGFLWDGKKHLSGKLELTSNALIFHFDHFKASNLNLNIPLADIQKVNLFKLFELTINGLEIIDKTGRTNMFVMDNPRIIRRKILDRREGV